MPWRKWTDEEVQYLEEKWGAIGHKAIAKHLNRSVEAIKIKAKKLGLGNPLLCIDGITVNQLAEALNINWRTVVNVWIPKYQFPAKKRLISTKRRIWMTTHDDFWKWAEENKQLVNFSRMEPNILGIEPDWVSEKRKADLLNTNKLIKRPWTDEDDNRLKGLVKSQCYTYSEIARILRRTEEAVRKRIRDLNMKIRPLYYEMDTRWTQAEIQTMVHLYEKGYGLNVIAEKTGKNERSCWVKLNSLGYQFKKASS